MDYNNYRLHNAGWISSIRLISEILKMENRILMNPDQLEKYSSAITLSDMEIFVFPELMYSLVLANIMSPALWKWRQLDCFKKLEGKNSYKKLMRPKAHLQA